MPAHVLNEVAARDAIFTADTGMCNVWTARYIDPLGTRRLIGSFLHGSMANALPHAIGAQVSHPHRQVISVSGDGGLSMLMGELVTARMHNLPIKVVVFNNSTLGMVKLEMLVNGLPDSVLMSTTSTMPEWHSRLASTPNALTIQETCAGPFRRPSTSMVQRWWRSSPIPMPCRCHRRSRVNS